MLSKTQLTLVFFGLICLLTSCATFESQITSEPYQTPPADKKLAYRFYLISDAGNAQADKSTPALQALQKALQAAPKNSTVLFLGDNIYPKGLPKKSDKSYPLAKHRLEMQLEAVKHFQGRTIFLPGNHDWYSNGTKGLKRQEKMVEEALGKNSFLPEDGCPLEKVEISEDIVLILVDSEWYITNWDKNPNINDDCEIKTRAKFFEEYESLIKKARGKTTIVALHHPMFTNGPHGGQYPLKDHLKPVPVLGTLKNIIRKTGGVSPADMQHPIYQEFRKRIIALSQENERVLFVSGHEHSLQYLVKDNLPQIVSGSGSKVSATRNINGGQFSYGNPGFAILDVHTDGSSNVTFMAVEAEGTKEKFATRVFKAFEDEGQPIVSTSFEQKETASIYSSEETEKGGLYTFIWGDRYRSDYSIPVEVPTVNLDTLYGGLTPVRKGGGHQSVSLRLKDSEGREYVMRALRKNALQYLQAVVFKDQYIEGQFEDTFTQDLLLDMFTGAHPYAPFVIGPLAKASGVYHTNPVLFYVPKQAALGSFNTEFGNSLYMIEERPSDGHGDKENFGFSNKIISTDDMLKDIHDDEENVVDEEAYIRARLFDMLIGDWDRHEDQWRWAKFDIDGKDVYRPIPRDRDQAFSKMSDGALLGLATKLLPGLKLLRSYDEELKSPKWFNTEPFPLDMALITQSDKAVWDAQVTFIQEHLTDDVIDQAFNYFPKEINQENLADIKRKLKGRRANLQEISDSYYAHINRFAVITGTDKDDWFTMERMPEGKTRITAYRIKGGEKADVFHNRTYSCEETKEIWVYGLDDDDHFEVKGFGDHLIRIRLIGGLNNDVYDLQNPRKVKVYDHKSRKNTFRTERGQIKLTDDYETNVYDHKKLKNNTVQVLPGLGFNPDVGLSVGASAIFTTYGFERNPFSAQHSIRANYYSATSGFDLHYQGEWANVIGHWNLGISGMYTNPNFAQNFFGFGNESVNNDDLLEFDFNRVNIEGFEIKPSLVWRGRAGGRFHGAVLYEEQEVERNPQRITGVVNALPERVFDNQKFLGVEARYSYGNTDSSAFPTLGIHFELLAGWKTNLREDRNFTYLVPIFSIDHKLVPSGRLVLATKIKGHLNFGDGFEFYQAAAIGGIDGLRGFRNQRFIGKQAFYQNTDLRLHLRKLKTGLLPLSLGVYGGFDYGRVWVDNEDSKRWNNSYGGGLWFDGAEMLTARFALFQSDDGSRFEFGLGFRF